MKKVFLLVLLVNVAFCVPDEFNLTEQGCEESGGVWTCHLPADATGLAVKFVGDIGCFSNVSTEVGACVSAVELQKTVNVDDCTYSIGADRETTYNDCQKVAVNKGTLMLTFIDSEDIGVFDCKKFQEDAIYVTQCSANSTEATVDGLISLGVGEEYTILAVASMSPQIFSLTGLIMDNLVYIILVALIIVVAYWVFAPHKPMLKERAAAKAAPQKEEASVTGRERRYGRKL